MSFFQRPIQNIKQIDYKYVVWMTFWGLFLVFSLIPFAQLMTLGEALRFIFSFDFLPVEEMKATVTSRGLSESIFDTHTLVKNRMYLTFNILKVLNWLFLLAFIIGFLFKKPKNESINR